MNSAQTAQRGNIAFFFLSVVLAVLMLAASGFFTFKILSGDSGGQEASTKSCLSNMRINGFNPTASAQSISVKMSTTKNIESLVYMSGVLIASCPAYTVTTYCAGEGCPEAGLAFTLVKKDGAK